MALLLVLLAALGGGPAMGEPEPVATVRFDFKLRAANRLTPKGFLHLRPAEGEGEGIDLPVSSTAVIALLPPGTSWEATPDLPGFWSPRKSFTTGEPGTERIQPMDLWPLAKIAGRVEVLEKGSRLPAKLSVTTLAPPSRLKRSEAPKGLLDCPIDEKGEWSCQLPAATFDLVISAAGLIPHYRWNVEMPPGKTLQLGTFNLKPGASVAGWVVVEDGALEPVGCIARLAPLAASSPRDSIGLAQTVTERKVEKDGFFQFTGVAPGIYRLEILQPGFAPAQVSPVKVWPRAESFVKEPVRLQRPLRLDVSLSPPLDWLGKPWRLEVLRSSESPGQLAHQVFGGSVGEDGQVSVSGQAPGTFHFTVLDSLGNRVHSERDVVIAGTADAQRTLQVDVVTVRGKVTLGREPLAATLWFGGRSGAESVKMESDETGRFHGILPQRKVWTVAVEAQEPKLDTRARVEVKPGRTGWADITIALPDTRVFGRVVDETGQRFSEVGEPERWHPAGHGHPGLPDSQRRAGRVSDLSGACRRGARSFPGLGGLRVRLSGERRSPSARSASEIAGRPAPTVAVPAI